MRNIRLLWNEVTKSFSQPLDWNRVVYALLDTNSQIYYIGKADDQNLRGGLLDPKKQELMSQARWRGAPHAGVICGVVMNENVLDLSDVVSNIEALLISRENPWGNTAHPLVSGDLTVRCEGTWLGRESVYTHSTSFARILAGLADLRS